MYFLLTEGLTNKFIDELRRYWAYHPKYRDELVDNIQGKYSFKQKPQRGIIVKASGANHVALSADNFKGMVSSYVYNTRVKDKPGVALEWVREDSVAIQENGGRFPSPPGVYYVGLSEDDEYYVEPLYDVFHEQVMAIDTSAYLAHPPLPGTLRLYEMPSGFLLHEGVNYTLGTDKEGRLTGEILLAKALSGGRYLQADYRWPGESRGPFKIYERHANNQAIPGVVLAFGRRCAKGDQMAVVVQDVRRPAYLEYGGRWEITLEFEAFARDVHEQREIADECVSYLLGIARSRLSTQGIEITQISMSGETEEPNDETGDDYLYTAMFSLTCETEWSLHIPLDRYIRQAAPLTSSQARAIAGTDDCDLIGEAGNIKPLEALGLEMVSDPFWSGKKGTFEVIR